MVRVQLVQQPISVYQPQWFDLRVFAIVRLIDLGGGVLQKLVSVANLPVISILKGYACVKNRINVFTIGINKHSVCLCYFVCDNTV